MNKDTIRIARQRKGMSQTEAAEKIGVKLNTYVKYENNPMEMRMKNFVAFCEATDTRPSDLDIGTNIFF